MIAEWSSRGEVHELNENEHLIGIYGVNDPQARYFKAFGLIVKRKND